MDVPSGIYKNKCCVPACTDRFNKRHRFPKDESLCKKWVENIKAPQLMKLQPNEIYHRYYVCNKHFIQEFIVPGTRRGLRKDAIPTLYFLDVHDTEDKEVMEMEVIHPTESSSHKSVTLLNTASSPVQKNVGQTRISPGDIAEHNTRMLTDKEDYNFPLSAGSSHEPENIIASQPIQMDIQHIENDQQIATLSRDITECSRGESGCIGHFWKK